MDSLKNHYPSYQFIYAAYSYNQMPGAYDYMDINYNFYYVPTTYIDGGRGVYIGGDSVTAGYRYWIDLSGTRATPDLYLAVSVDYISPTELQIHYEVASLQNQAPSAADQATAGCSMILSNSSTAFTTRATDPDADQVYYRWAFGNGDSSVWMGPYSSGDTCMISYSYPVAGNYNISILTKDPWLVGSTWSSPLAVNVINCQCGEANGDGAVNISDAVYLIAYIFAGGTSPGPCSCDGTGKARGDANGDEAINISDAVYLIAYIFAGGVAPHCP